MPRRKGQEKFDEEVSRYYYTAQQAMRKLGMDRDRFNYIVKTRNIQRVPFLGGYGYYKKSEIDNVIEEINAFLVAGGKPIYSYRTATLDTLDDEIELAALNFTRKRAERTKEARIRFLQANPEMTHYLYYDNLIVASMNLIPFTHDAIEEFRKGKRGWLFDTSKIEQFEPGHRLECVIIDMMTTTKVIPEQRYRYAAYLLKDFARNTLVEWGKRGVDIATVDACAGTIDGERILRQAEFEQIGVLECENRGEAEERNMYHLDADKSRLALLRPYKEALAQWKREHN